jgi:hypothetical protein
VKYLLVTYERAHDALEAAACLQERGIMGAALIPRPRTITARCGVALRIEAAAAKAALALLMQAGRLGDLYSSTDGAAWTPCAASQVLESEQAAARGAG